MNKKIISILCLGLLAGCQTTSKAPITVAEPSALPTWEVEQLASQPVIEPDKLFALSSEQEQAFLRYFYSETRKDISPHQRLANYLENIVAAFSYKGLTLPAQQALSDQQGNCLSLAILTTALAKVVNLKVRYQKVHSRPVYKRLNNVMAVSTHVRTFVLSKPEKSENTINFGGWVVIDYFPSGGDVRGEYITENDFISMFYQNAAATALHTKNVELAYNHLEQAMSLNPFNAETLNYLAVIHKLKGNGQTARQLYEYVIDERNESLNVLYNYMLLLAEEKDNATISSLQYSIKDLDDDNPYNWYDLGNLYRNKREYTSAIRSYKKVTSKAPYLSEGYLGLATTYYSIGNYDAAKRNMRKAVDLAFTGQEKRMYSAKLTAIEEAFD